MQKLIFFTVLLLKSISYSCELNLSIVDSKPLEEQGDLKGQIEVISTKTGFRSDGVHAPLVQKYQEWVKSFVPNTDPYKLIEKQKAAWAHHFNTEIFAKILFHRVGSIGAMNCLETSLFARHLELLHTVEIKSEFIAHILVKGEEAKILFISTSKNLKDEPKAVAEFLRNGLAQGFVYSTLLHNHPFYRENAGDVAGTLVPSGGKHELDISYFLEHRAGYQLQEARIING